MGIELGEEIITIDTDLRVLYMTVRGKVLSLSESTSTEKRRTKANIL